MLARNRSVNLHAPLFGFALAAVLMLGCEAEPPSAAPANEAQVQAYFARQEQHARKLARIEGKKVAPEVWPFFAAGAGGDWSKVTSLYHAMGERSHQFEGTEVDDRLAAMVWQPINESFRFYEQCAAADPKHLLAFGREVIASIPPGSILFSGTDHGRFVVSGLGRSAVTGDPLFVISQNALVDGSYLKYLQSSFGQALRVPGAPESQAAFEAYVKDARLEGDRVQVSGIPAIMEINARIARTLFEQNPDREFFLDDKFPLDWTYPHLEPHGLMLRLNRRALTELDAETVARDRAFWKARVAPLIGDWLTEETPLSEVCVFTNKVYVRKDLAGFTGDPRFIQTARPWSDVKTFLGASSAYGHSRAMIGRLYFWRAQNATTQQERERMLAEADFAFRQAIALCPYSADEVYDFVKLLVSRQRIDDALLVVRDAMILNPEAISPIETYVRDLKAASRPVS